MSNVVEVGGQGTPGRPPGVRVREESAGVRFVGGVKTSVAAFLARSTVGEVHPARFASWSEFTHKVRLEDASGAGGATRSIPVSQELWAAVYGWFGNGGGECYLAPAGGRGGLAGALASLESYDEITIVVAPDLWSEPTKEEARTAAGLIADHCRRMADRVAVLHLPNGAAPANAAEALGIETAEARRYTAVYHPWINVRAHDPQVDSWVVPPTGHVAGVWARVDEDRGVHKAPANENLRDALGLTHDLDDVEQIELNDQGVNAIRKFPGAGLLVWGARTLAASDETEIEHSYLNVRRSVNFIRQSIRQSTDWGVFEANDDRLRTSVKAMVTSFLTGLWRRGMLVGASPEQAFYVICDESDNPPEGVAGLRVEVGVALVRPAEFIAFEVAQLMEEGS
ncbi:hypothetical protein GCM10009864_60270 [Streptomyces lunalinharesii]|uniref:Phage tail sheath family protein n=2 Tax=Streptomyces lunalinharesii TaxID=333384 RepID=A0ABN3SLA7_9ACTN